MVNAEFSRIYRFVKLLVNEGFLAVKNTTLALEIVFKLMAYDCQGVMRKCTILTVYCAKSLAGFSK